MSQAKFPTNFAFVDKVKDKIESFKIIKGDEALKEYNAKNGVVLIKTKSDLVELDKEKIKIKAKDAKKKPIVIIDGIKSNREDLEKLNPDVDIIAYNSLITKDNISFVTSINFNRTIKIYSIFFFYKNIINFNIVTTCSF